MRKTTLLFGLLGGALIALLKLIEYRFLVVEHSLEIYGGLVALVFSALGVWLGPQAHSGARQTDVGARRRNGAGDRGVFVVDRMRLEALGITPREHEILGLIAAGLSNREIAERLFVSENTVKTHSSRLFDKLQAKRRTQAVQRAKEAGLIA